MNRNMDMGVDSYTLNEKIMEWTWQFHGHGAAQEIPCTENMWLRVKIPVQVPNESVLKEYKKANRENTASILIIVKRW